MTTHDKGLGPRPITPDEVDEGKHIPAEVIEAFNELIAEGSGHVKQKDAVARIVQKMGLDSNVVYQRGWLNVEGAYRKAGWKVDYDKPGYNETYDAFFVFTRRR